MKLRRTFLKSVLAAFAISAVMPTIGQAKDPLPVVATFSILGDMVSQVGGDHIALTTLVGHDGDAHVYQPTPADARAVSKASVLFVNGLEFEGWIDRLVDASGFKGTRIIATKGIDPIPFEEEGDHDEHGEHAEHGFEWAGVFDLAAGTYKWSFAKVDGDYADPAMKMVVLQSGDIEAAEEKAEALLEADSSDTRRDNDVLVAQDTAYTLTFDKSKDMTVFSVDIKKSGKYAFFTEHMPFEFEANEHFFKDLAGKDVEPIAQEPDTGHHGHGHHHHGTFDPHAWQSVQNAIVYINNITSALSEADPANADTYKQNSEAYIAKLKEVEAEISAAVKALPESSRTVVTSHDAFGYFEKSYGLAFKAPTGISTESEASAADVAKLINQIREEGITAVFVENIADNRLLEQISSETGAQIGGTLYSDALSAPDGPAATYLEMMRYNSQTLSQALGS
ncbi:MAG: zinc ABC transporter substrate-binding protein [Rhizobiaceae bacterium]|nr:zinc ABC transporter substrate-binding protein [Rhizobiaceae bacterium]